MFLEIIKSQWLVHITNGDLQQNAAKTQLIWLTEMQSRKWICHEPYKYIYTSRTSISTRAVQIYLHYPCKHHEPSEGNVPRIRVCIVNNIIHHRIELRNDFPQYEIHGGWKKKLQKCNVRASTPKKYSHFTKLPDPS